MENSRRTADALSAIRKESLDIFNRLHSIEEDVVFVKQVKDTYSNLPMLPNLRCGAWYTDPSIATDIPAYFKSTDGHYGNWGFNLRRANLHLLPFLFETRGLVLVDSTRSGKRIPDALSKTVPIWCAVINRALPKRFPEILRDQPSWDTALYTPPAAVSRHEHNSILTRLDGWAEALANSSYDLPKLPCPLRPIWITPSTRSFPPLQQTTSEVGVQVQPFIPIICVSASKQVQDGTERRSSGFSYIQGSGDDHELWGMGLTPELFWTHHTALLSAERADLCQLVEDIVLTGSLSTIRISSSTSAAPSKKVKPPTPIGRVANRISIGRVQDIDDSRVAKERTISYLVIHEYDDKSWHTLPLDTKPSPTQLEPVNSEAPSVVESPPYLLRLRLPLHKSQEQHFFLHTILPSSRPFIERALQSGRSVNIVCPTGKDLSVGVALAAICMFFDDAGICLCDTLADESDNLSEGNGENCEKGEEVVEDDIYKEGRAGKQLSALTKKTIKTRLEWVIASRPEANPSRTTLKRVNEYLLTPPAYLGVGIGRG